MKRFSELIVTLDTTNKTSEKVSAIERYFADATAEDAAWALFFLSGKRLKHGVKTGVLRAAALEASALPVWMFDECYEAVGDLSETIALLLPDPTGTSGECSLGALMQGVVLPLIRAEDAAAAQLLVAAWRGMDERDRFVFNKLVRGNFRVGVQRALVVRALSGALGVDPAVLAHRLTGHIEPTGDAFLALAAPVDESAPPQNPYPFCLAAQIDVEAEALGPVSDWQIEHKWDGIRAQIVRRGEASAAPTIWSRGEEPIAQQFPEIVAAARALSPGTVLDGEILAWRFPSGDAPGRVLSFNALQRRLNRKVVEPSLFETDGVVFAAFDVLEMEGRDVRSVSLAERRKMLAGIIEGVRPRTGHTLQLPEVLSPSDWGAARRLRAVAREKHGAEGLMLKHVESPYHVGRVAGGSAASISAHGPARAGWWNWKVDPYSVDAVLISAQQGSGRRAGLYTDYTFGVWDPDPSGVLTPFAKAYSGLDNEEIGRVDAFVRANTLSRAGPVRMVRPELVFEISFEGIQESMRHRSGVAVRFPRMTRWRTDKRADQADTLASVRAILRAVDGGGR